MQSIKYSLRAVFAVAAIVAGLTMMRTTAFAQFDVDAFSHAGGPEAGEYPFTVTVEYSDGTMQEVAIGGNGVHSFEAPGDNFGGPPPVIVAWWFLGQRYIIPFKVCVPWAGGCICFCVKCAWPWPWWPIRCRFLVYWSPCC